MSRSRVVSVRRADRDASSVSVHSLQMGWSMSVRALRMEKSVAVVSRSVVVSMVLDLLGFLRPFGDFADGRVLGLRRLSDGRWFEVFWAIEAGTTWDWVMSTKDIAEWSFGRGEGSAGSSDAGASCPALGGAPGGASGAWLDRECGTVCVKTGLEGVAEEAVSKRYFCLGE